MRSWSWRATVTVTVKAIDSPRACVSWLIQPIADVVVIPSLDTLHDCYSMDMDITNRTQVTDTWECKEALRQVKVQSHELEI